MPAGVGVVGPHNRLGAADALALRRDREALVVQVGHRGGALVGLGDREATVAAHLVQGRAAVAGVVADGPQAAALGVPLQIHDAGEATGERRHPGVAAPGSQRVAVDAAVGLEPDEEETAAVPRVGRRVVERAGVGAEAGGDQRAVRHPGDGLEAGVGRDTRQIGGQGPFVGGREWRAAAADVVAQDRGPADAVGTVVALRGDVDPAGRARSREGHAFGVRHSGAVRVAQHAGGVDRVAAGSRQQPHQRAGAVVDGVQRRGIEGQTADVTAQGPGGIGRRDVGATGPRRGDEIARADVGGALGRRRGGRERTRAVGAAAVRRGRVRRPCVGVDQGHSVGKVETRRVGGAETEHELGLVERQVPACRDRRAAREGVDVGVDVVLEDPTGHVQRGRAVVDQLDPVTGVAAAGLDLVDPHRRGAVVGRALGRAGRGGEGACRAGAATVGRRRMRGPRVGVDQGGAVAGEEPDGVRAAEAEPEVGLVEHVQRTGSQRRPRRDRVEGVGVVGVLELQARQIHRRRAGVDELCPVADRVAVRLDLVEAHRRQGDGAAVGGALRRSEGRHERAGAVGAAAVGRGGVRRPGVGVDQRGAVRAEEACRVAATQAEDRVEGEVGAGRDRRARRDGQRVRRAVVAQHQATGVHGACSGVDQLDPVRPGSRVARLDLVDAQGGRRARRRRAAVGSSLGGGQRGDEGAGAVGAAAIGRVGVGGPGVGVHQRGAVGEEQSRGVGGAETEVDAVRRVLHVDIEGEVAPDRQGGAGRDRVGAGVRVVAQDHPADRDRRRTGVGQLDPVLDIAVGLDLVDRDGGQVGGLDGRRDQCETGERTRGRDQALDEEFGVHVGLPSATAARTAVVMARGDSGSRWTGG
ncbi:unannotated protein [freshwater metagenome]|uniref:Unannotated protein n=1 Tax=freshwater metagenome TaxID=449393 RepID=A0A6J6P1R3_9ZZZZ